MNHIWLYISRDDLLTEEKQCREEGKDWSGAQTEFRRLLALDVAAKENQPAAEAFLDFTAALPQRAGYAYQEPSTLAEIRALRPAGTALPAVAPAGLEEKVRGAWTGRVIGCLLGKPVEGWRRDRMQAYLGATGQEELHGYFRLSALTEEVRQKYALLRDWNSDSLVDCLSEFPIDDDINYTVAALSLFQRKGASFTPLDVAEFWLREIPLLATCTAERVAYRNLALLKAPPHSAQWRNPYREWIGAQIRGDFLGYAAPGNPELAADYAWRDASISHVKNGIYGAMWFAAMNSAAFVASNINQVLDAGLEQIPQNCRLADGVRRMRALHQDGQSYAQAVRAVHQEWDENSGHDWCHTISNAMIVTIALLWGEGDYVRTICRAVQACFDTDCNGATAGSIVGAMLGQSALPTQWTGVINDTVNTSVAGYNKVTLGELAAQTLSVLAGQA